MSDPPERPAEPVDLEARTLARILGELDDFRSATGARSPRQALARILRVLADAGYATPGEASNSEQVARLWFGPGEARD